MRGTLNCELSHEVATSELSARVESRSAIARHDTIATYTEGSLIRRKDTARGKGIVLDAQPASNRTWPRVVTRKER